MFRHVSPVYTTTGFESMEPYDAMLQDFVDAGFVTIHHWPEWGMAQAHMYDRCQELYKPLYNWMGMLDVDEFLVVRDKCASDCSLLGCIPGLLIWPIYR
jgi:hypothetical protein